MLISVDDNDIKEIEAELSSQIKGVDARISFSITDAYTGFLKPFTEEEHKIPFVRMTPEEEAEFNKKHPLGTIVIVRPRQTRSSETQSSAESKKLSREEADRLDFLAMLRTKAALDEVIRKTWQERYEEDSKKGLSDQ